MACAILNNVGVDEHMFWDTSVDHQQSTLRTTRSQMQLQAIRMRCHGNGTSKHDGGSIWVQNTETGCCHNVTRNPSLKLCTCHVSWHTARQPWACSVPCDTHTASRNRKWELALNLGSRTHGPWRRETLERLYLCRGRSGSPLHTHTHTHTNTHTYTHTHRHTLTHTNTHTHTVTHHWWYQCIC